MTKSLFGRLMAPLAKLFNQIEMRFHIDIFQQQGLVRI
jgi:hypothetical protein